MGKKVIAKRAPREKIHKLPRPSTRSQNPTFTPSPSPPTSPPRSAPMARTKTTPRHPAPTKPTPPPKATTSKPGSSKPGSAKPSSSKGKRPAPEEPVPEPTQPKSKSVPVHSQRVKHNKGPTQSERVVLDDEDDDFVPEDSPSLSTEGTSISIGKKSALLNMVKDVVQEFVFQSNHMIAMSKEQRKLASKHENFLKKSRERVAVFMTFIDNLQKDDDTATDVEEEADSEGNGSNA
ncbi:vegetative cell wall protein gp1-like [Arachis stenosperma]|uniref:vegetative cell wall protein gp1-like n=1 Tax=Arachis stenosperma TaxID=217475 RepID=UPI0025ABA3CA|nr:vegetative cell wall protein gp1-like [Arachis stenosperma]XP_057746784.1 vegetative cell wall protein gp1-like [Arachis stenosperma]